MRDFLNWFKFAIEMVQGKERLKLKVSKACLSHFRKSSRVPVHCTILD